MINWHLEVIPIKSLKPHPKNPRKINKEQLKHLENLIRKFGLIDKPIINLDKTIIGGHQRIKILKNMCTKTVECWVPDQQLTDEDIDHLCIGLNRGGSWDWDIMANLWEPLDLLKYGFNESELLGTFEDDADEKKEKKKKNKLCPNCGHEF